MKAALFPGSPTPNPFRPDQILSEASGCLPLPSVEVESGSLPTCSKQLELINQGIFNQHFYRRESVAINRISGLGYLHMFSSTKTQFSPQNSIHSADSLTTLDHQKEKCYANRATLPCTYEQQIFQSIHLHKENPWYCFMRSGWVALKHVSHLRLLSLPAGKKVDCTFRHFSFYIRT